MQVWRVANLDGPILQHMQQATNLNHLIFTLLQVSDSARQQDIVMMLWAIWKCRNDKVWNNEEREPIMSVMLSRKTLMDWEIAKTSRNSSIMVQQRADSVSWQRPNHGCMKCNVDAATFSNQHRYGIDMCIRNDLGEFVRVKTMIMDGVIHAEEAEARGLWEALTWVGSLGLSNVTFEMDCKSVVDKIHGDTMCQTEGGVIINTCKEKLRQFLNYSVSFIMRQANFVVHLLARASKFHTSHQTFDYMPACIVDSILKEME